MKRFPALVVLAFSFAVPVASAADIPSIIQSGGACNFSTGNLSFSCIPLFVAHIVQIMFFFVGTIALIQVMISGYQMMIGRLTGSDDGGKKRLRTAIIGFVMSVMAFLLIDIIIAAVVP